MKRQYIIWSVILSILLSSCTTMKGLKETKDEFKKGNILTGAWTGLMSVTVLPIVDVFTLGGSMDAEQSKEVWTGVAQQYSNQQIQKAAQLQAQQAIRDQQARQLQEQQAAIERAQRQASYGTVGSYGGSYGSSGSANSNSSGSYGTINSGNGYGNTQTISNGQNNTNTSKPKKIAKGLNGCVSLDTKSNSLADFWIGHCGQHIWIDWVDQGECRTGCADSFTTKVSINKTKGQVVYAACPYGYSAYLPNAPQPSGYKWDGRSAFECRDW